MKKLLLATLLILIALPLVQAELVVNKYTNDFTVSSPYANEMKACACENRGDLITVTNTGNFYASYLVDILSEQPEWYGHSLKEFTLAPGESQEVVIYAQAPCDAVGLYPYTIRVASSFGREELITRNFEIKKCQNAFLTVEGGANESNLGQPVTYQVTVKNVAEFADTFTLDLGSFNEHATYEGGEPEMYLLPNEERTFNITITPPPSIFGEITYYFTITSEKNGVTEQRQVHLSIANQFDHEIVVDTQHELCSRIDSELIVTVRNLIDVPNTFDVIISGPGFVNYEVKELELDGDEAKNLTLDLTPKKGAEGDYTLRIRVNSDLGDIRKEREVELNVFDCFAFDVGFLELESSNGEDPVFSEKACCGEREYVLNIRNAGQTEETYNILVDGPAWFASEERTIRLQPSENRNVKFHATLPCTDETYDIPVTVQLTRHEEITEKVIFRVESLTQRSCHALEASPDLVNIDEEETVVPFIVRHTGLEGGVYDVSLDGELYAGTSEERISLEPGEEMVLHVETKANLTDYFDGRYLSTLAFTLDGQGISYHESFWTGFDHVGWLTHAWRALIQYEYLSVAPCLWMMLFLLILLIIGVILFVTLLRRWSGEPRKPFTQAGLVFVRTLLVLLLLVVAFLLLAAPLPEKASLYENQSQPVDAILFEWFENEEHVVDLADYFDDPDADWLEYTATQPAHIAVEIEGSIATFSPDRNWAGTDRIVFTATDQRGGYVDSPIITLRVLQRKELSMGQWLLRYCTQLNLALLLLILLLLVLLSFLVLAPKRRLRHAELLEPPRRPKGKAVHTLVTREGQIQPLTAVAKSARKAPKKASKKVSKRTAEQKAALSKALDRALVSCEEEHEMKQVLRTHGKRETKKNVERLQEACRSFKADKRYKRHNRESFYQYLEAMNLLDELQNTGRKRSAKKGAKRAVKRSARRSATKAVATRPEVVEPQPLSREERVESPQTQVNIAVGASTKESELVLVGARNGKKVHDPQCMIAQRIPKEERVAFTTKADASTAGYAPCKVCQSFDRV